MRLKKGMKIEVLNTEEDSIGIWRLAEIISCNGRSYHVKYSADRGCTEVRLERVRRHVIRPCPPPVQGTDDWVLGDIVEVYQNQSWRAARIVEVDGMNNYTVRLLGCAKELICHKLQLRVRQVWEDGKWLMLEKCPWKISPEKKNLAGARRYSEVPILYVLSKVTTKRKSIFTSSGVEEENQTGKRRLVVKNTLDDGHRNHHQSRMSTETDTNSCASSVGSCSAYNSDPACSFTPHLEADAESSRVEGCEYQANFQDVQCSPLERRSHSSELQAYSRAIEGLFASGPFSWEEESNISDLRRSLNISDDEHLNLVRTLVSSHTRIPIC